MTRTGQRISCPKCGKRDVPVVVFKSKGVPQIGRHRKPGAGEPYCWYGGTTVPPELVYEAPHLIPVGKVIQGGSKHDKDE